MTREFSSIGDFLVHLAAAEVAVQAVSHRALDKAAEVIERDAKEQIGEYQPQVGPFQAWPQLADSTKEDRVRQGFTENEPLLRTGGLRDSISREVHQHQAVVGSTSDVMVYQELGTSHIPPRPVLGPAAFKSKQKIIDIVGRAVVHAIEYGTPGDMKDLP